MEPKVLVLSITKSYITLKIIENSTNMIYTDSLYHRPTIHPKINVPGLLGISNTWNSYSRNIPSLALIFLQQSFILLLTNV